LWLTCKQAAELGGQVRKGEKGSLVVYANKITKTDTDETGADALYEAF
jgi:antirestriction protein ArdC